MNYRVFKSLLTTAALLHAATAFGQTVIYEPFDYPADDGGLPNGLDGENGGIGFNGAWDSTKNNPTAAEPGLEWGGLVTVGNYARGAAWSGIQRPLGTTSSLDNAGLMSNGSTLWFSAIMGLEGQNTSNADINISLGTDRFVNNDFGNRENLAGTNAQGIGIAHSGGFIQGVYWNDVGSDGIGERNESSNTSVRLTAGGNPDYALIVGKIDWGADNNANEILTLYAPDAALNQGSPILNPWSIPALDQSFFDTLAIQFKDQSQVDEIRFGASYEDVAVLPDPLILRVNTLTGGTTLVGDDDVDVQLSYYQINSAGNSLNENGWNSFADQDIDGNGPANGTGDGWEEAGGSGPGGLAEGYLLGDSIIGAGAEFDLGFAYNPDVDAQDLIFEYVDNGNDFEGIVEYFASPIGDMDGDGSLTEADITGFVQALTDRPGYAALYPGLDPDVLGDFSGDGFITNGDIDGFVAALTSAGISVASVPEPGSMIILAGAVGLCVRRRRERKP